MISEKIKDKDGTIIYPSRSVAGKLRIGRNAMLKRLRELNILDSNNHPVRQDRSLYRAHISEHNGINNISTYFTDKAVELVRNVCSDLPKIKIKKVESFLPDGLLEILNE